MRPGAFVRVLFPTREKPRELLVSTATEAMIAKTASQPWPDGTPLPAATRYFDAREAKALNRSRAFISCASMSSPGCRWPRPGFRSVAPGEGVIAVAPAGLQDQFTDLALNLVRRRRALIQMREL